MCVCVCVCVCVGAHTHAVGQCPVTFCCHSTVYLRPSKRLRPCLQPIKVKSPHHDNRSSGALLCLVTLATTLDFYFFDIKKDLAPVGHYVGGINESTFELTSISLECVFILGQSERKEESLLTCAEWIRWQVKRLTAYQIKVWRENWGRARHAYDCSSSKTAETFGDGVIRGWKKRGWKEGRELVRSRGWCDWIMRRSKSTWVRF